MTVQAITTDFPNGFPNGVAIRGIPLVGEYSGNVFFVGPVSQNGANGNKGNYIQPFLTLEYALSRCKADNGDIIFLMPGFTRTQSIAGDLTIAVNGVSIIGLGTGSDRPTFTFGTLTTASVLVSADNVTIQNILGVSGINALANPFNVTGDNFWADIEWNDSLSTVEAARAILLTGSANSTINLKYVGFVNGDTVVNAVRLIGCSNVFININTYGICTTAWVQFLTTASTNVTVNGQMYTQGITNLSRDVVDTVTGSTGFANIIDVSAGVAASGGSATSWVLSSDDVASLATAVAAIQADIGNPSGAGTTLDAEIRTGYDSTSVTANQNGSVMEMQKFLIANTVPDLQGFAFGGTCNSGMTPSTTSIVSSSLVGYGDGYFANKYYLQILLDGVTPGAAPEMEVQPITAYTSSTGTFTTNAFTVTVKPNSRIFVMHESIANIGRNDANNAVATTAVVANADGSVLERAEFIQSQNATNTTTLNTVNVATALTNTNLGDPSAQTLPTITAKLGNMAVSLASTQTTIGNINTNVSATEAFVGNGSGTQMATNKAVADALGSTGSAINDSAVSIAGMIGPNNANNAFDSSAIVGNADGSAMERLEFVQSAVAAVASSASTAATQSTTAATQATNAAASAAQAVVNTTVAPSATSVTGAIGTRFWVKKILTSSAITQAGVAVATASTGGELGVLNVILETDGTGLATGTNVQLYSSNTIGRANLYVEAVAFLGASTTSTSSTTTVTTGRLGVLQSGSTLTMNSTAFDCTGGGTVAVYVQLERLTAGATIAAA